MSNFKKSFSKCIDSILEVGDTMGANLHDVFLLTRTWSGAFVGDGSATDVSVQVKPTPQIVDFSHDLRLKEGGAVKAGDLILKNISKTKFPLEDSINGSFGTNSDKIERFYRINSNDYQVINVKENLLTWDVQLRKLTHRGNF